MRLKGRWTVLMVLALCVSLLGPVAGASARVHKKAHYSAKQKRVIRARLMREIKKNPKAINRKSFLKKASLVNFKLPVTIRLRNATSATNPNTAKLDLGASLGQRAIGLGGSLSGEITFHDSYDGGALGNVDISLNPGPKGLSTTSVPLLWNTDVTNPTTSIGPTFGLTSGTAGCGDFHGATAVTVAGHQTVPYWNTQAAHDSNAAPDGYVGEIPGVDDPARLVASPAVGNDDNVGPSANPFPYTSQSDPGSFAQPPNPGDSVLRTAPLSLQIASPGTEVNQADGSGVQGSQNVVIGKSGGQANLFGNIPGKSTSIDVTVNLATKINSIIRAVDPDNVPLISPNPWPTTSSDCRQAYTGAVQNYIPSVHLQGTLHISPAITSDGKLRIAKATLASPANDSPHIALAACLFPYSLYAAENNGSDSTAQTVGNGSVHPTNEFVARSAPSGVNCGSTPTKLVQDAPTLQLAAAQAANGYSTTADGSRVSVAGDLTVNQVSADILVGDTDDPPASPALPASAKYLAVGDSLGYGYQAGKFASLAGAGGDCSTGQIGANLASPGLCANHFNTGYVDDFASWVTSHHPGVSLTTTNDGCPGETTSSLVNGYLVNGAGPLAGITGLCGRGSGFPYAFLHHNYGLGKSQLQDAVAYLTANPTTSIVTLNIGANDLLVFLQQTCGFGTQPAATVAACVSSGISGVFSTITGNINTALNQLQAAAPNARYIVIGNYNPYPATLAVGAFGGDTLLAQLNSQVKTLALAHGARFVDPEPVFNPSILTGSSETNDISTICALTNMCPGGTYDPTNSSGLADIHPTDKGYAAMASLIDSASGL